MFSTEVAVATAKALKVVMDEMQASSAAASTVADTVAGDISKPVSHAVAEVRLST